MAEVRRNLAVLAGACQGADLLTWAQAPYLEVNLVPAAASPFEVVALKAIGAMAVVAGAFVLAHKGLGVVGNAVLVVAAGVAAVSVGFNALSLLRIL